MADSDNECGGHNNSGGSIVNAGGELSSVAAREQDRFLPIANVSRIMKKALPANAKISKDAKETVQECVSEFISFITGEASDKCQREKRKTLNGDDLIWAMTTLGFEEYVEPLKVYLQKFREVEGEKGTAAGVNAGTPNSSSSSQSVHNKDVTATAMSIGSNTVGGFGVPAIYGAGGGMMLVPPYQHHQMVMGAAKNSPGSGGSSSGAGGRPR